jgi:hypothetical protein
LQECLAEIIAETKNMYKERNLDECKVNLNLNLEIDSVCSCVDTLYIASRTTRSLFSVELSPNGIGIAGVTIFLCNYPDKINTISDVRIQDAKIFMAVSGEWRNFVLGKQ